MNELVTNAAKHGQASRIMVRFQPTPNGFSITVGDDGNGLPEGFDPGSTQGLGVRIVASVATEIGGGLQVERGPNGRGSRFTLTVPDLNGQPIRDPRR